MRERDRRPGDIIRLHARGTPRTPGISYAAVGTLAAALLAGCGGGAPEITGDGPPSPASEHVATSGATPTPGATTSTATAASPASASTTSTATAATPTPGPTDPGTTPPSDPPLPAQAPAEHGGTAVAVYLAVTDDGFDSAAIEQARAAAEALGYEVGGGSLGCDRGAAEALGYETGAGQTWAAVALYFATLEEAERVRAAAEDAGHAVEGVAEVTTYCLD